MKYFDNASTTKISDQALEAYVSASKFFHNPSALYSPSVESNRLIEDARSYILDYFNASKGSTLIFTSGATESNNAVLNNCITRQDKKYLIGGGEHSSIYATSKHLLELGYNIQYIPLTSNGGIDLKALESMLDEKVAFVSVMHVSNETGAINDIKAISRLVKGYNPKIILHSDGVQAVGKLNIDLNDLGVDYYTMSAHKINGPKGVGLLYIANPNKYRPYILGGEQERGLRAGTENVPGIVAFKEAIKNLKINNYKQHKQAILDNLSGAYKLVSNDECVDNIISLCFKYVRGETLQHIMESEGYLIGTGSACNSKAKTNRVLEQIVDRDYVGGAVRISFDSLVTIDDCIDLATKLSNAAREYINITK